MAFEVMVRNRLAMVWRCGRPMTRQIKHPFGSLLLPWPRLPTPQEKTAATDTDQHCSLRAPAIKPALPMALAVPGVLLYYIWAAALCLELGRSRFTKSELPLVSSWSLVSFLNQSNLHRKTWHASLSEARNTGEEATLLSMVILCSESKPPLFAA